MWLPRLDFHLSLEIIRIAILGDANARRTRGSETSALSRVNAVIIFRCQPIRELPAKISSKQKILCKKFSTKMRDKIDIYFFQAVCDILHLITLPFSLIGHPRRVSCSDIYFTLIQFARAVYWTSDEIGENWFDKLTARERKREREENARANTKKKGKAFLYGFKSFRRTRARDLRGRNANGIFVSPTGGLGTHPIGRSTSTKSQSSVAM